MNNQNITTKPRPNALRWRERPRLVDGGKPRGRHGKPVASDDGGVVDDATRRAEPVPINQRLGYRPAEFAALLGISYPTVWRRIKSGKIKTIVIGGVKVIPRAFAIECGLISEKAS